MISIIGSKYKKYAAKHRQCVPVLGTAPEISFQQNHDYLHVQDPNLVFTKPEDILPVYMFEVIRVIHTVYKIIYVPSNRFDHLRS